MNRPLYVKLEVYSHECVQLADEISCSYFIALNIDLLVDLE